MSDKNQARGANSNEDELAAEAERKLAEFEIQHPKIAAWWNGTESDFAISLRKAVQRYGSLTPKQMAVAIERAEEFERRASKSTERGIPIDADELCKMMAAAKASALKRPTISLAKVKFIAAVDSRGRDAIFVRDAKRDTYLGTISGGRLYTHKGVPSTLQKEVGAIAASPKKAILDYGKEVGRCALCGRPLKDPESVERGVGPTCRLRFAM